MLAIGLPGQLGDLKQQGTHRANGVNHARAHHGRPTWWLFLLTGIDQGHDSRSQLSIRKFALGEQTCQFAEQGFVHVSPVDCFSDAGLNRAPKIRNASLHHQNGLIGGGEQAVAQKTSDLHGSSRFFDSGPHRRRTRGQPTCVTAHDKIGQHLQILMDIEGIEKLDSLEHLGNLLG